MVSPGVVSTDATRSCGICGRWPQQADEPVSATTGPLHGHVRGAVQPPDGRECKESVCAGVQNEGESFLRVAENLA